MAKMLLLLSHTRPSKLVLHFSVICSVVVFDFLIVIPNNILVGRYKAFRVQCLKGDMDQNEIRTAVYDGGLHGQFGTILILHFHSADEDIGYLYLEMNLGV